MVSSTWSPSYMEGWGVLYEASPGVEGLGDNERFFQVGDRKKWKKKRYRDRDRKKQRGKETEKNTSYADKCNQVKGEAFSAEKNYKQDKRKDHWELEDTHQPWGGWIEFNSAHSSLGKHSFYRIWDPCWVFSLNIERTGLPQQAWRFGEHPDMWAQKKDIQLIKFDKSLTWTLLSIRGIIISTCDFVIFLTKYFVLIS